MQSLIVRNGLMKKTAEGEGPSFEQQFGILTNSMIVEKLPSLDNMKLAFQLIEKSDDDTKACGAAVYLIGENVIFVPSFFKQNKIQTGDMMFIAQTQQFLPLSDAWVAWLRDKDLKTPGKMVPMDLVDNGGSSKAVTIRDIADPITKTASKQMPVASKKVPGLYFWEKSCGLEKTAELVEDLMSQDTNRMAKCMLRGILYLDPDMKKTASDCASILDVSLHMGKPVAESMVNKLVKDASFLNATMVFYSPEAVDKFAKEAAALEEAENTPTVELILPLTKEAKTLNAQELKALHKDGFFIRKCANVSMGESPDVVRQKQIDGMFRVVNGPGKASLLQVNGSMQKHVVLPLVDVRNDSYPRPRYPYYGAGKDISAPGYMRPNTLVVITNGEYTELPNDVMHMQAEFEEWKPEMAEGIGKIIKNTNFKQVGWHDIVLVPSSGYAYMIPEKCCSDAVIYSVAAEDAGLKAPIVTGSSVVVPYGSRIVKQKGSDDMKLDEPVVDKDSIDKNNEATSPANASSVPYATVNTFDAFLGAYLTKKYHKTRVYSDGGEFVVSGDKSDGQPQALKEAALHLVEAYDIEPAVAKIMLKEASNGATFHNPKSLVYYIEKKADFEGEHSNPEPTIGANTITQVPPQVSFREMPTILEDPANLEKAITSAANAGIKEVFDITALKILARQNHFFDEIQDDIPSFMRTLDSLCRKLFQFYWHTEKMEEKYGTVKLKALEDSLKCTLDSLSDLTIFFKVRTVDGTRATGDVTGDLMSGQML